MAERICVLVSACLLGARCRYDGGDNAIDGIDALKTLADLIPVCPERLGGLPTPRAPAERRGERVVSKDGRDVTEAFRRGAEEACRLARRHNARYALTKSRSPSCGFGMIYDGTFTGRLVPGSGVAAQALAELGVKVFDEYRLSELIEAIDPERK